MALVLGNMGSSQSPPSQSTTPPRRSLTSPGTSLTPPGTSITPPRRAAQNSVDETFVATTAAIETLPKWNDCKLVGVAMRKKKRNSGDVSTRDTFATKAVVALSAARYSKALKDATIYYSRIKSGPNAGKKGYGPVSIVDKWNREVLTLPSDRKLSKSALSAAVHAGRVGHSPPKRGRPRTIPLVLTETLAAHATMLQVSGEGDVNRQKMVIAGKALMMGTEWEHKICPDYLWRKVREDHPALLNPVKQKHNEDRRVDWLTYKNVNDWTDRAKAYLCELGMVKNEPGFISELLLCFLRSHFTIHSF